MSSSFDATKWSTSANPQFGFWFHYPRGWVNVPDIPSIVKHPADAKSFLATEGGKTQRVYSPALTLMMMPRGKTAGQSPAEIFTAFKSLLPSSFQGFACRAERVFTLSGGQEAREISFEFLKSGNRFFAILAYVVRPDYIFVFDGSSLAADFSNHEAILRQGIRSLRFAADAELDAYEIDGEGFVSQTTAASLLEREKSRQEHERAVDIMDRGDYRTALGIFQQVLQAVADDPDPMLSQNIAVCHAHLGEFRQAVSVLEEALRRWPDNSRLRQNYEVIKRDAERRKAPPGTVSPPAKQEDEDSAVPGIGAFNWGATTEGLRSKLLGEGPQESQRPQPASGQAEMLIGAVMEAANQAILDAHKQGKLTSSEVQTMLGAVTSGVVQGTLGSPLSSTASNPPSPLARSAPEPVKISDEFDMPSVQMFLKQTGWPDQPFTRQLAMAMSQLSGFAKAGVYEQAMAYARWVVQDARDRLGENHASVMAMQSMLDGANRFEAHCVQQRTPATKAVNSVNPKFSITPAAPKIVKKKWWEFWK